jgi:hypothetical protein
LWPVDRQGLRLVVLVAVEGVGDEVEIVGNQLLLAGGEPGAGRRKIDPSDQGIRPDDLG